MYQIGEACFAFAHIWYGIIVLVFIILPKSSQGQHKFEKHVTKYFFVIGNLFSFRLKENLGYSRILDFMVLAWDCVAVFNPQCIM
jgi:hypothetical protein